MRRRDDTKPLVIERRKLPAKPPPAPKPPRPTRRERRQPVPGGPRLSRSQWP